MNCPNCKEELIAECFSTIPDSQILKMKITPSEGQMIGAEAIGKSLVSFSKLMSAMSKRHKTNVDTFVKDIIHYPDGEIEFVFIIARHLPARLK